MYSSSAEALLHLHLFRIGNVVRLPNPVHSVLRLLHCAGDLLRTYRRHWQLQAKMRKREFDDGRLRPRRGGYAVKPERLSYFLFLRDASPRPAQAGWGRSMCQR